MQPTTFSSATVHRRGEDSWSTKAIIKIMTVLGINPQGSSTDVVTRLGLLATKLKTASGAITASATQTQVAATALTSDLNRVVTVGTAGDAVRLPAAVVGMTVTVINAHATNAVGIFPASGDAINAIAADGVYSLAATKSANFMCARVGVWSTLLSA